MLQSDGAQDPIVIVAAGDKRFTMPLYVTLYSALVNTDPTRAIAIYILSDGIAASDQHRISSLLAHAHPQVTTSWLDPDIDTIKGLRPPGEWHSRAAYLRLLIPELVPEVRKAIYLDSDMIVEGDLADLWATPLKGRPCAAVEDYYYPTVEAAMSKTYHLLEIPPETAYFNSGLLVINLEYWRTHGTHRKALSLLAERGELFAYGDQDALNAVSAGKWLRLDRRWNVQQLVIDDYNTYRNLGPEELAHLQQQVTRFPLIVHYTGRVKPWHYQYDGLLNTRFHYYLRHSAWFSPMRSRAWVGGRVVTQWAATTVSHLKKAIRSNRRAAASPLPQAIH